MESGSQTTGTIDAYDLNRKPFQLGTLEIGCVSLCNYEFAYTNTRSVTMEFTIEESVVIMLASMQTVP